MDLYDDIYYLIFNKINNIYTTFLRMNKYMYQRREKFLINYYYLMHGKIVPRKRHPIPYILIKHYKYNMHYYLPTGRFNAARDRIKFNTTVHIMEFVANKNRQQMIYSCKNGYHRKLAHTLCESQSLLHKTIYVTNPKECNETSKAVLIKKQSL